MTGGVERGGQRGRERGEERGGERSGSVFEERSRAVAFDLSCRGGAMALAVAGKPVARAGLGRREQHAANLVPVLARLLAEVGMDRRELTDVVVGEGPGSFTGVRVAAAAAKGLVRSLGARLWPVSSLAAAAVGGECGVVPSRSGSSIPDSGSSIAVSESSIPGSGASIPGYGFSAEPSPERSGAGGRSGHAVRYVLFDARDDRVFGACYHRTGRELRELIAPHADTVGEVLQAPPPEGSVFCGDAALRHEQVLGAAGFEVAAPPEGVPSPEGLLRCLELTSSAAERRGADGYGRHSATRGSQVSASSWEPSYLRPWRGGGG